MLHCCTDRKSCLKMDQEYGERERGRLPLMLHCRRDRKQRDPTLKWTRSMGRERALTPNATLS